MNRITELARAFAMVADHAAGLDISDDDAFAVAQGIVDGAYDTREEMRGDLWRCHMANQKDVAE